MNEMNGVMMQYFHWYIKSEDNLWEKIKSEAQNLAEAGFTSLWLPPAYKGSGGGYDVGYGVYDHFDLGEFDQKGSIPTKYGTKEQYIQAISEAQKHGLQIYADIVFNHKMGGDAEEEFNATPYNPTNRNEQIGDIQHIKAWTNFKFEARQKKYSELEWHWWHFNAADYNAFDNNKDAVYLFEGKTFAQGVDLEWGNFDFLMGCNLDVQNEDVRNEMLYWGEWYIKTTNIDGFRFDAVKHIQTDFFMQWLGHLRHTFQKNLFAVGEYWSYEKDALRHFIDATQGNIMLFDVALHKKFSIASKQNNDFDLTTIFDDTLVQSDPNLVVTIVDNHDTQPLQALESVVEAWFKPIAYSLILLRKDGYPCIFYPDYYGASYKDYGNDGQEYEIVMPSHKIMIDKFLDIRKKYAYGDQYDYFDHSNCIGWTRIGNEENPFSIAVVISNGSDGSKFMETRSPNTKYKDLTEHIQDIITTDQNGWANFRCPARSVSVWVEIN